MSPELVPAMIAWLAVFVFSTTLHEAAHAWAALRLGDETAYQGGQVSLNPVPHMQREPFGMLIVPIISFILYSGQWMIGWASAPYDPRWAYHYPKKAAWMALAGPVSNLLLSAVGFLSLWAGVALGWFELVNRPLFAQIVGPTEMAGSQGMSMVLSILFSLNLVLFVFNLIPLPPMDGSAVIQLFMSEEMAQGYQRLMANGMWSLVGLVAAWRFFPEVFRPLFYGAVRLLYSLAA